MINFTKLLLNKTGLSGTLHKGTVSALAVWNVTGKCNLSCKHCYISAEKSAFSSELSTVEAKKVIDSFVEINAAVVLFSGGEPLLREDLFELINYATKKGIKCALSSNGTLITPVLAKALKAGGVIYVGISIDGDKAVHDKFRGAEGFDKALTGLNNCKAAGIPVGVRFTLNKYNHKTLPAVLNLVVKENIPRFCMYHLVYSGRADKDMDINKETKREVVDYLMEKTVELADKDLEILTVDSPCDGIYLYKRIIARYPQRGREILDELSSGHGRCSAGERILSVSPQGDVYSCQFWNHKSLGNVRETDLYDIWANSNSGCDYLNKLREKELYLEGKCGTCNYKEFCGGCRLRARGVYNNIWQEDPACYLTEEELQ